ncbi:DUF2326 domain-containing protein [Rugamonas apoptosis]|uniref:DUF2326 domain-containing protein n=1 Tax=Rugamonas apoptosis TaxID=2758570 RepID=A0A7W2IJ66_9BURK|nr:DUF2326 domain-containing protein [Rugamonas apoptosis]MBA5685921.1 DUF2326 domain-containing protein [Rugamonas apoptosis]
MKLNNLKIQVDGSLVREVKFVNGLNLVLNRRGVGRSGNSVGKSTLARVVDYLFMGSISPIYIDEEFKKSNERIESLFQNSHVEAQLEFIGLDDAIHTITRNLCVVSAERKFYVDGKSINESAYEESIQRLCFDVTTRRPSVRFVAPKFMRNDSHKMLNTTKFIDQHASAKDYSELFLYLFGFENTALLTEKREATNLVTKRKKHSSALNAIVKEQKPSTEIGRYRVEAQELERDFLRFNYSPKYVNPIERLNELQIEENEATDILLDIERKIANIGRTVEMLDRLGGNYLVNEVKEIYDFAGVVVDGAISRYEDLLAFHDSLVARKKQFIATELPALSASQLAMKSRLEGVRSLKLEVFADMRSEESMGKITQNLKALGELKVKLGRLEGLIEQRQIASNELSLANDALKKVLVQISTELATVKKFGEIFNKHFKYVTNLIHAEPYEFTLEFDEESGICNIDIKNKVSNPEGGKKKAEVIAYDLAYILAVAELDIKRPRFVFHDSIEDIDQKQIDAIFALAEKIPGQQIVSMLSDKFTEEMYERYLPDAILLLSEDDMFFRC